MKAITGGRPFRELKFQRLRLGVWLSYLRCLALLPLLALTFLSSKVGANAVDGDNKTELASREAKDARYKELQNRRGVLRTDLPVLTNFLNTVRNLRPDLEKLLFQAEEAKPALQRLQRAFQAVTNAPLSTELKGRLGPAAQFDDALNEFSRLFDGTFSQKIYSLETRPAMGEKLTPIELLIRNTVQKVMRSQSDTYYSTSRGPFPNTSRLTRLFFDPDGIKRESISSELAQVSIELFDTEALKKAQQSFEEQRKIALKAVDDIIAPLSGEVASRQAELASIEPELKKLDKELFEMKEGQTAINSQLVYAIYAAISVVAVIFALLVWGRTDITLELIHSRLAIEIATMTFLLLTIMILGLSEKLEKASLGTLIGAVAGYLLSRQRGESNGQRASGPAPTALEIRTLTPKQKGNFDLAFVAGGGTHATAIKLQWKVAGVDTDFGHDMPVVSAGQSVATGAAAGVNVSFRTKSENSQGTAISGEQSAVAQ